MSENPKVSIIIPCYNAEKYIEQCIVSAFNQNYKNIEVIAVDNESKDGTYQKLLSIKERYPSLIIDSAPNVYKHSWDEPRSKGLEICTGNYVTFVCADDFLEPFYVEECMKYILSAPDKIKAFQSPIRHIKNNKVTGFQQHSYRSLSEFKKLCVERNVVNTPTVIYNIELYKNGLLNTKPDLYLGAADYDMYCNLADNNIFIYPCNTWIGYNYRWHDQQATWGMHKEPINYDFLIQSFWKKKWNI